MIKGSLYWEFTEEGEKYLDSRIMDEENGEFGVANNNTSVIGTFMRHLINNNMIKGDGRYYINYYNRWDPGKAFQIMKDELCGDNWKGRSGIIPYDQHVEPIGVLGNYGSLLGEVTGEYAWDERSVLIWRLFHKILQRSKWNKVYLTNQAIPYRGGGTDGRDKEYNLYFVATSIHRLINSSIFNKKFIGDIYIDKPLSQEDLMYVNNQVLSFEGNLYIKNEENINLRKTFPFEGDVIYYKKDGTRCVCKSVKEYIKRPERTERLKRKKEAEETFKTLTEKGYTPVVDSYGIPLKIQDHVAYKETKDSPRIRLGEIVGCTAKRVTVREISTGWTSQVTSSNMVKI